MTTTIPQGMAVNTVTLQYTNRAQAYYDAQAAMNAGMTVDVAKTGRFVVRYVVTFTAQTAAHQRSLENIARKLGML